MGLIPNEAKAALAYLKSIDKSLGRIADALEKDKKGENKDNGGERKTASDSKV